MRHPEQFVALLLVAVSTHWACAETATELLLAESDPAIQAQIAAVFDSKGDVDMVQRVESLKSATDDKAELIKQLAIFSVTAPKKEEFHVLETGVVLHQLETQFAWQGTTVIRILAPYLDSENQDLRDFVQLWFHTHDSNDRIHGKPPLGSVNYHEYMEYVRSRIGRKEEIPTGFIEYIYEKHPGKALLVFAKAMGVENMVAQLQAIHEARQANRQGQDRTPEEIQEQREEGRQLKVRQESTKNERREILLAEHVISNAIWLKENGFAGRFQQSLPEAQQELKKLAEHDQWWARLYVAHIMQRYPELRLPDIQEKLREDSNELVSRAAKGESNKAATLPPVAPGGAVPLVAPREVESRAVGAGKIRVDWQASVGATSYDVLRRRPDTEKEFTTIATDVKGTTYTDDTGESGILFEYAVVAKAPD